MRIKRTIISAISLFVLTINIFAQGAPQDVRDLIGSRAAGAETQLRNRGYSFVRTSEGNDRKWSTWWNGRSNTCITVTTIDGRYSSITTASYAECHQSGGNSGWGNPNWGGGGGGQNITPPSWAQGTFYGRAPDGSQIQLTIGREGNVTARIGGATSYGSFTRGNFLNMGGAIASVTRQGNGILTRRTDNGEQIPYTRNNSGGGWDGGSGGGWGGGSGAGGQISPPSWARGTFYGQAPDGSQIQLTISNEGQVTAVIGGNSSYGTFTRGNYLNMGGAIASVTRQGNGILTSRTDNGERIAYTRSGGGNWNGGGGWNGGGNYAQFDDLIGSRASSAESQLRSRGFRSVDSSRSGNTSYTIWWRSATQQCIESATVNGRYDSITDIGSHRKCN